MNIFEQIALIAQNEQKVYDAGYEKGKAEGGDSVPVVLEELTITRNGEYEPGVVSLGETYKFKDNYTSDELKKMDDTTLISAFNGLGLTVQRYWSNDATSYSCEMHYFGMDFWFAYLPEESIVYRGMAGEPGWYDLNKPEIDSNGYKRTETPTLIIPTSLGEIPVELSVLSSFLELPPCDGYNKVNVNVEPELKELTVTQNGIYKSGEKIEFGGTYSFKASYTNDELKEIRENSNGLFETEMDGAHVEDLTGNNEWFFMVYESWNQTFAYLYVPEEVILNNPNFVPTSGWFNAYTLERIEPPTVTLPEDTWFGMDLSALASLVFGLNLCDGFSTVIVDVKGDAADISLGELTVTQNGIYTPRGDAAPKINGIYQFKDDFTGVDFSAFAVGEPTDQNLGWWLSNNIYYAWTEQKNVGHVDVLCVYMGSRDNYYWVSAGPVMISTRDGFVTIPSAGWWIVSYGDYMKTPIVPSGGIFSSNKNDNIPVEAMLALFKDGVPEGEYVFKDVPNRPFIYQTVLGCSGEWQVPNTLVDGYPAQGRIGVWITDNAAAGVSFSVSGDIYPEVMYVYTSIPYYGLNEPGWYARDNGAESYSPCDVPTEKFPVPIMEGCYGDMSQTMLYNFFEVPEIDGFDRVEVNVPVGPDTSDATATEDTILDGFSAYVNGEKITGTKTFNLQEKTVETKQSIVVPDEGYDGLSKVSINVKLNLQEINIDQAGTYTPDEGYDGFSKVNVETTGTGSSTDIEDALLEGTLTRYTNNRIESMRRYAFYGIDGLQEAYFQNCKSISYNAFAQCPNLKKVEAPSCTEIGNSAFYSCPALSEANYPNCTTIGMSAFYSCKKLTTVSFPACTSIGDMAFALASLQNISFPACQSIGKYAFSRCSMTEINFPECNSLGSYAFTDCTSITEAKFDKCLEIGQSAFQGCTRLQTISFPLCSRVMTKAFFNCSSLAEIVLPQCVVVNDTAFGRCTSLTRVELGGPSLAYSSTIMLWAAAFSSCTKLQTLQLNYNYVATLSNSNAFVGTPIASGTGSIYVPASLVDVYKVASNWSYFADQIAAIE